MEVSSSLDVFIVCTAREKNFVVEKLCTFQYTTVRMKFNLYLRDDRKKKWWRHDRKACETDVRKFGVDINFALFPIFEIYEIKSPTKIYSFTACRTTTCHIFPTKAYDTTLQSFLVMCFSRKCAGKSRSEHVYYTKHGSAWYIVRGLCSWEGELVSETFISSWRLFILLVMCSKVAVQLAKTEMSLQPSGIVLEQRKSREERTWTEDHLLKDSQSFHLSYLQLSKVPIVRIIFWSTNFSLTLYVPIIAILDIWKTTLFFYEGESVVHDGFKYVWPVKG